MKRILFAAVFSSISMSALAAVRHTKAQAAYFAVHDQCVLDLNAAAKDASGHSPEERRILEKAAKEQYRRCEAYAHLVWKYYPNKPPQRK